MDLITTIKKEKGEVNKGFEDSIKAVKKVQERQSSNPEFLKEYLTIYDRLGRISLRKDSKVDEVKTYFKSNFLKEAERVEDRDIAGITNPKQDYIQFTDKDKKFYILISTTSSNKVIISREESLIEIRNDLEEMVSISNNISKDVIEEWDKYNKEGKITTNLVNAYSLTRRGKLSGVFYYLTFRGRLEEVEEYVESARSTTKKYENMLLQSKEDEKYNQALKKETKEFLNDILEDLEEFKESGWELSTYGIEEDELEDIFTLK